MVISGRRGGGGGGTAGAPGLSAYQVAQGQGFAGTVAEWLASLEGGDGAPGLSAYQVAVANGFVGTVAEWLASLKGKDAAAGAGSAFPLTAIPTLPTWVNQTYGGSSASYDVQPSGEGLLLSSAGNSTDNLQGVFRPLPGATFDIRVGFVPLMGLADFGLAGIALRESSSGKITLFGAYNDANGNAGLYLAANYNSPSSKSGNVITQSCPHISGPTYARVKQTATTREVWMGHHRLYQNRLGYNFTPTSFLVPDQIGIIATRYAAGARRNGLVLLSWEEF